jgi:hypothetical protein
VIPLRRTTGKIVARFSCSKTGFFRGDDGATGETEQGAPGRFSQGINWSQHNPARTSPGSLFEFHSSTSQNILDN